MPITGRQATGGGVDLCALAGEHPQADWRASRLSGPRPVVAYAGGEVVVEVHLVDAGVLQ